MLEKISKTGIVISLIIIYSLMKKVSLNDPVEIQRSQKMDQS